MTSICSCPTDRRRAGGAARRAFGLSACAAAALLAFTDGAAQVSLDALLERVHSLRQEEAQAAQAREAEFVTEQHRQERLAQEALARRNAAESRSKALDRQWQDNETHINELTVLLRQHEGNLGELFGVTRQVAGDAANVLQQSQLSVGYIPTDGGEERATFLRRVAAARALPSITELERLWFELHREMTDGGKVMRLGTNVVQHDGPGGVDTEVVLIGPFSAVADGQYLGYLPSRRSLTLLEGQLPAEFRDTARFLQNVSDEDRYVTATVDPARGALLGLWLLRPDVIERIGHGKEVGYVIIAVGALGGLAAFLQFVWLARTRLAVRAQLADPASPSPGNPLGRVMLAVRGDGTAVASPELAELRLSEAVLREVPKLERFQAFLRLAVAAGPLLGLIGTVIGMIITFKAITASGTSDPKLMAQGIGQAMIATVLGLGIAIPLLFINAGLGAVSRSITQLLEEQCHELLAAVVTFREGPWDSAA
jgi:biopolymer transport protein ExbB